MLNDNNPTHEIYYVAIYGRLSRDDNVRDMESMSIANQVAMLKDYVERQGWVLFDIYTDDGFSGTNFDRPAFQKMKCDIETGKVNLVITKDLSRFGRDYTEAGYYIDKFFPMHKVRYIALHDGVDTIDTSSARYAPIRNVMNDDYARDISMKVRLQRKFANQQGYFMGNIPPYGYLRSTEDKHKLVPDEYAGRIVQSIFSDYAHGDSARMIAERLSNKGVQTPRAYFDRILKDKVYTEEPRWGSATIYQMLKNEVYLGHMVNGKRGAINYKLKKRIAIPKEKWYRVENTHQALIDNDTWSLVQKRFATNHIKAKASKRAKASLFAGILRCADCGGAMAFTVGSKQTRHTDRYRCSTYTNKGKDTCSNHMIHEVNLIQFVKGELKAFARMAKKDQSSLLNRIKEHSSNFQSSNKILLSEKMRKNESRIQKLDERTAALYEDKCDGLISGEMFQRLTDNFTAEKVKLEEENQSIQAELGRCKELEASAAVWLKRLLRFVTFEELTREILVELIDKIEVWERTQIGDKTKQKIRIHYRFIGALENLSKKEEITYDTVAK